MNGGLGRTQGARRLPVACRGRRGGRQTLLDTLEGRGGPPHPSAERHGGRHTRAARGTRQRSPPPKLCFLHTAPKGSLNWLRYPAQPRAPYRSPPLRQPTRTPPRLKRCSTAPKVTKRGRTGGYSTMMMTVPSDWEHLNRSAFGGTLY